MMVWNSVLLMSHKCKTVLTFLTVFVLSCLLIYIFRCFKKKKETKVKTKLLRKEPIIARAVEKGSL
jgi:hypothetical protein